MRSAFSREDLGRDLVGDALRHAVLRPSRRTTSSAAEDQREAAVVRRVGRPLLGRHGELRAVRHGKAEDDLRHGDPFQLSCIDMNAATGSCRTMQRWHDVDENIPRWKTSGFPLAEDSLNATARPIQSVWSPSTCSQATSQATWPMQPSSSGSPSSLRRVRDLGEQRLAAHVARREAVGELVLLVAQDVQREVALLPDQAVRVGAVVDRDREQRRVERDRHHGVGGHPVQVAVRAGPRSRS